MRIAVLCAFPLLFSFLAFAQYSIDSSTISGGGGTSTNGQYSLTGTVGQPVAGGAMTNGPYSVTGDFLVLPVAIQTEGAPLLIITPLSPGSVTLSWTPSNLGFALQERTDLSSGSWTNSTTGPTNPIIVPTSLPVKFYRLSKP
jgi:hypothetical protein